jgi:hypothetical protein
MIEGEMTAVKNTIQNDFRRMPVDKMTRCRSFFHFCVKVVYYAGLIPYEISSERKRRRYEL